MFELLKLIFSLSLRPHLLVWVFPSKAEYSPIDIFLHHTTSADFLASFIFNAKAFDQ